AKSRKGYYRKDANHFHKYKWICKDGHSFHKRIAEVLRGKWCDRCPEQERLSDKESFLIKRAIAQALTDEQIMKQIKIIDADMCLTEKQIRNVIDKYTGVHPRILYLRARYK